MRLILALTITFAYSLSWAALPWDKNSLTEIPAYQNFPAQSLTIRNLHKGTYFSSVQGDDADFIAWLPDSFDPLKKYDLIIFLGGGTGSMWQFGTYAEELRALMADHIFDKYVIVSPDADNFSLWGETSQFDGPAVVIELKNLIQSKIKYSGKSFVIGHSNGGPGAINLAYTNPKDFSSVVAISPTLIPWSPFSYNSQDIDEYIKNYAPTFTAVFFDTVLQGIATIYGTSAQWDKFDPYKHITNDKLNIPLAIFTGSKDELGFYHLSQLYTDFAKKNGVQILYSEDPNRGHAIGNALKQSLEFFQVPAPFL